METNQGIGRETLGLMLMISGCSLLVVILALYLFVEDLPDFLMYILLLMFAAEVTLGMLIRKGIFLKGMRSDAEVRQEKRKY